MTRYRTIRKYGNTFVIVLSRPDIKDFNIIEGDEVEVEDILKNKRKGKKQ